MTADAPKSTPPRPLLELSRAGVDLGERVALPDPRDPPVPAVGRRGQAASRARSGVTSPDGQRAVDRREVGDVLDEQSPVPSPQACSRVGSAAAAASPAAMPTAESSADEITTGMSICAAMPSSAETPPSGATLSTAMSAAPARTTASGSVALRMLSSAATGTSVRLRTSASSGTVRQGLLEVLQRAVGGQRARRGHRLIHRPAAVGVHPHGRDLRAYGVDPGDVVGQRLPRLGDLHLRGPRPQESGPAPRHPFGGHRRHRGVDRDAGPPRGRRCAVGGFDPGRQPVRGLGRLVLENAPNSPQPAGPSISATSRSVMPRNRTRIGSATTCSRSSRSSRAGSIRSRGRGSPSRAFAGRA